MFYLFQTCTHVNVYMLRWSCYSRSFLVISGILFVTWLYTHFLHFTRCALSIVVRRCFFRGLRVLRSMRGIVLVGLEHVDTVVFDLGFKQIWWIYCACTTCNIGCFVFVESLRRMFCYFVSIVISAPLICKTVLWWDELIRADVMWRTHTHIYIYTSIYIYIYI